MMPEDYDMLIDNPTKFLWETILFRKYKDLQKAPNSKVFRKGLKKYAEFGQYMGEIIQINKEFGIPDFFDPKAGIDNSGNGYELLFNIFRGIRGLSYDIRRTPDKVLAAIDALDSAFTIPRLERSKTNPNGSNDNACFDANPVLIGHTILSPKQFKKFYWPHFERIINYAVEQDKLIFIFVEGDSERFYDYFRELPEGHFALHVEQNDIFKMKKELPNVTVSGGMPVDLLGKASTKECVDYAKKLIDELGYDGKYIFSENKMMSFPHDCSRENLKATYEFVCDYRS